MALNLDEEFARIERAQEATRKFVAEWQRRMAEAPKAERPSAADRWLAAGAACGGTFTAGVLLLRAVGALWAASAPWLGRRCGWAE